MTSRQEPLDMSPLDMPHDVIPIHANFYARPAATKLAAPMLVGGVCVRPVVAADGSPPTYVDFFPVSFEQACERLRAVPAIDIEPDGFFVWSGFANAAGPGSETPAGGARCPWRLSGHLFDFNERVHRLELHGACPETALHFLWSCLGWPATPVACELIQDGVALDESEFRKWAAMR